MKHIMRGAGQLMLLYAVPTLFIAPNPVAYALGIIGAVLWILAGSQTVNYNLGLNPANQPAVSGTSYDNAFLNTFDVLDSIKKPVKHMDLMRRFGDQGASDLDKLTIMYGAEPVPQDTWSVFLEDFIISKLVISNFSNVGDVGTLTVSPTVIDSLGLYYAGIGDDLILPNQNTAIITNKVGNTLTAQLKVTGGSWGTLVNGSEIGVFSNSFIQGSDQPTPKAAPLSEEGYGAKIMKTTVLIPGSQLTSQLWFSRLSDGSLQIPEIFSKAIFDAEYRMKQAIDGAIYYDQPITNATLTTAGYGAMTGVIPWVRGGGNVASIGAVFNLSQLYNMSKTLKRYYAPNTYYLKAAGDAYRQVEVAATDLFTENPIGLTSAGDKVSDIFIEFKSIHLDGMTFFLDRMNLTLHPEIYDLANFTLQSQILACPMGSTKRSGGSIPYLKIRYRELNGYNRRLRMWYTGGAGPYANNTTIDTQQLNILSEMGTQPVASNHWYLFE